MPGKQRIVLRGSDPFELLVVSFAILFLASIHFSRGLLTISTLGIATVALFRSVKLQHFGLNRVSALLLILALLWLLDGLRAIDQALWLNNFMIKSGFVIMALSFYSLRTISPRTRFMLTLALSLSFLVTSSVSVVQYFRNAEKINALLLQSKHVPLFSEMHHIHFGLFLAVAVFLCLSWAADPTNRESIRWIFGVMGLLLLFNLHVLSSRTGLTGFYAAGAGVVLMVLLFSKDRKLKVGLITGLIVIPSVFIVSLPSLRSKMLNTGEDIEATVEGGTDINHKSFGMRVEFWKTSLHVIREHWMTGIGIGNQAYHMERGFEERNSLLNEENRRTSSHNQFMETFMTNGIPGFVTFSLLILLSAWSAYRSRSWLYAAILILSFWGLQFESLLERQHGALFIAMFLFLFWPENRILEKDKI